MTAIETVYDYHARTKHSLERYARSLGYMDWSTQPDPFRTYDGTHSVRLPLALEHPTPPYHLLEDSKSVPSAPLVSESISQLFQFALGLSAWKAYGTERWALRCNASSGNLHPTEAYLITPPIKGICDHSCIAHYAPKTHGLELLATFRSDFWEHLPKGSFLIGLSSVLWREAWKYGERSFRYCQLDAGHAWRALDISAKCLGWYTRRLDNYTVQTLDTLLGLIQSERFFAPERESSDMLLLISPESFSGAFPLEQLVADLPAVFDGNANRLSPSHHYWEVIESIEAATHTAPSLLSPCSVTVPEKAPTMSAKEVIMNRRSAQMMDPRRSSISKEQFLTLLRSVATPLEPKTPAANLVLFVHNVESLAPGIYLLLRNPEHLPLLQAVMDSAFAFKKIDENLYLLKEGNFRFEAKHISCNQDIAKDGAFSLGMLCEFSTQIDQYGPQRYKELYHECGAIGQQLYLEATSLGLSATGIGCFLDDMLHNLLGLKNTAFQSLYHFTVGRPIIDTRLTTLAPYHER